MHYAQFRKYCKRKVNGGKKSLQLRVDLRLALGSLVSKKLGDYLQAQTVSKTLIDQAGLPDLYHQLFGLGELGGAPVASSPVGIRANSALVCHMRGTSTFVPLNVNPNAVPGHLGHGDGQEGDPVPGMPMKVFGEACELLDDSDEDLIAKWVPRVRDALA